MAPEKLKGLHELKEALRHFARVNPAGIYQNLSAEMRAIHDLAEILYSKVDLCLEASEASRHSDSEGNDLATILVQLARQAQSGALAEVLTPENVRALAQNGRETVDLAENALRKKDTARYLDHSADTDAVLAERDALRDAMKKKDPASSR